VIPAISLEDRAGATCVKVAAVHGEVLRLLRTDDAFIDAYAAMLSGLPYAGFFWETPPLTSKTKALPYECMVIPSEAVAQLTPNAAPFARLIGAGKGTLEVIASRNLGGDAELVIPCDSGRGEYAHLASFLRTAPRAQIRDVWRKASETVERWLEEAPHRPVWLSTSGLGVSWLHIRIDTRPKYYSHAPYRQAVR
jgi:hypothetical protein